MVENVSRVRSSLSFSERIIVSLLCLLLTPLVAGIILVAGILFTVALAVAFSLTPFVILVTDVFVEVEESS